MEEQANDESTAKYKLTVWQNADDSVGVKIDAPDAVTALGLTAYLTWQIHERLNEMSK